MPKRDNVSKYISGAARRAGNLSRPLKSIGTWMLRSIAKNFQAGGRPEKWQESLRAKMRGGKTLQKSGQLKAATSFIVKAKSLVMTNKKIYARILQEGGPQHDVNIKPKRAKALKILTPQGFIFRKSATIKKGSIKPRPFLTVQDEDERFINKRIGDWLVEGK